MRTVTHESVAAATLAIDDHFHTFMLADADDLEQFELHRGWYA